MENAKVVNSNTPSAVTSGDLVLPREDFWEQCGVALQNESGVSLSDFLDTLQNVSTVLEQYGIVKPMMDEDGVVKFIIHDFDRLVQVVTALYKSKNEQKL